MAFAFGAGAASSVAVLFFFSLPVGACRFFSFVFSAFIGGGFERWAKIFAVAAATSIRPASPAVGAAAGAVGGGADDAVVGGGNDVAGAAAVADGAGADAAGAAEKAKAPEGPGKARFRVPVSPYCGIPQRFGNVRLIPPLLGPSSKARPLDCNIIFIWVICCMR